MVEPKGHCAPDLWAAELWAAQEAGLVRAPELEWPALRNRFGAVFVR